MLLADIICQNITSEKTFQEVWMLISCLSCINRAVSRRGSDRPEGYVGKCILYEHGLQGGLLALPASPHTPASPLCQQPHRLWTSSGRKKSFPVGFSGHSWRQRGLDAKGLPPHTTEPHLPLMSWGSPAQGHLQGVTGSMTAQTHLGFRAWLGPTSHGWRKPRGGRSQAS